MLIDNFPFYGIIIPTLNSSLTIAETIYSIINQTYSNIEVLVMDGLSSDNTCDIIKQFKEKYIKIFIEKDKGIYDAMNKGIKKSKGDFLYFMGSDDIFYSNNTLEKKITIEDEKNDILYGNVKFKYSKIIYSGESSLAKLTESKTSICHQAMFYSKNVFIIIGNYNLKYFIHADFDFNIRCFKNKKLNI